MSRNPVEEERPFRSPSVRCLLEETIVPRLERSEITFLLSDVALRSAVAGGRGLDAVWDQELPEMPSRFLSPRHAHGAHEVCWVLHGRCVLTVDARALGLKAGDVCV
ncbi:MAG: hypothetical protein HY332_14020, partial [Chloroflexi bacterium]|nr:hypothetical protein [Chloroflexota bacterium]